MLPRSSTPISEERDTKTKSLETCRRSLELFLDNPRVSLDRFNSLMDQNSRADPGLASSVSVPAPSTYHSHPCFHPFSYPQSRWSPLSLGLYKGIKEELKIEKDLSTYPPGVCGVVSTRSFFLGSIKTGGGLSGVFPSSSSSANTR